MASDKSAKKKAAKKKKSSKAAEKSPFLARSFFLLPFSIVAWLTKGLPGWIKWPARAGLSLGVIGAICGLFLSIVYFALACTYDLKEVEVMPARTEILDRNGHILKNTQGREIGYLHGKNRLIVDYDEVSPFFVNALIAQEDARFRSHGAVDFLAFGRVAYRAVTRGKLEGGGTISMQLARNSYVLKKPGESLVRGIHRKILETFIAVRIESKFEKDEILQHYMNRIFWGGSIRGIEVASKTYLDKSAKELTLSDSALLAGIIRAPNRFNPFRDLESATVQRDWVLTKMLENGFITAEEAEKATSEPLQVATANKNLLAGSYALDAIRRDLDRILEEENIRDGGLIIETTLDPNIQEIAEKSVENRLAQIERRPGYPHQKRASWNRRGDPPYIQGAAVVIDNNTGAVLAIVGGRNATESQFNRALQATRPVGSIFKPFMYLAAFDRGIKPYDTVSDAPIQPGEIPGVTGNWSPLNSDGKYYQKIPVSQALIESRNTSSVRVANVAGFDQVFSVARSAGFDTSKIDRVPSSFLGSWGATPEAVASAYTIFPNGGTRFRPYYIQSIKDRDGNILFENGPIPYRATEAGPAWEVSRVLEEVNRHGTGRAVRSTYGFTKPSGGKTGTTNGPNDAWYAGYTSAMTCAVWVGMDHGEVIIKHGSGASLALPIWADIMKAADRLPGYKNGPIAPGRAVLVRPAEDDIPRAVPVDDIPEALPVN
ncbi:transglycosylase domain-containing protein [Verrucomicrobiaceae bacterium 227]